MTASEVHPPRERRLSTNVAPLPTGTGVATIAGHRPRREPDAHHAPDEPADGQADAGGERGQRPPPSPLPPAPEDDAVVPAEMLFAATLIANRLVPHPVTAEELRLRSGGGWQPPDLTLRLKDKLI